MLFSSAAVSLAVLSSLHLNLIFGKKIGEVPVKTTLVVLLVAMVSTAGGVAILEEGDGKATHWWIR